MKTKTALFTLVILVISIVGKTAAYRAPVYVYLELKNCSNEVKNSIDEELFSSQGAEILSYPYFKHFSGPLSIRQTSNNLLKVRLKCLRGAELWISEEKNSIYF